MKPCSSRGDMTAQTIAYETCPDHVWPWSALMTWKN